MSVIQQESPGQIQVYQLAEGPLAGQTFYGSHKIVCTNPACPCTDMLFLLRRHNDEPESQRSEETWEIVIDVEKRTISRERTSSEATDHVRFAEAFVSHLSEAHWNVFHRDLVQQRQALLDDATYLESAYFDFSDLEYTIEHESAMVFFDTVFPFGRAFDLEVHGERVTLVDQYCLNSRCACTSAILSAFPPFGSVDGTDSESIKPLFTVKHNYQTHEATVLDELDADFAQAATSEDADMYLRAPKADRKQISALVKKRHRMLRSIYQAYRKRTGTRGGSHQGDPVDRFTPPDHRHPPMGSTSFVEDVPSSGKLGRNQACPCGSGRKYKHCCGR